MSNRCRACAVSASGRPKPRARSVRRWRRISIRVRVARCIRASPSRSHAIRSARTGTAISAAAVGVGARLSEAKSISVVSVSWPTAEISGISLSAAARTTISSLNPQRSSSEPPPRATINRSGRGIGPLEVIALNPRIARATSAAQPCPCTATGQISTWRGKRSRRRCKISRITAPDGEVITPMTLGRYGIGRLRSAANSPSAASALRRASSIAISAPAPAGSISSTIIWYLDCPGKVVSLPVAITSIPSSGRICIFETCPFHEIAAITERSSLRSKYICPEAGRETRPISPRTRIRPN